MPRHSTIGRPGLNSRVRGGYACSPRAHRRQILPLPISLGSFTSPHGQQYSPYFFPLERRGSSRTFRYGYLVTTSPQSPGLPSAAPPLPGSVTDFGHSRLPWCDGRCVQDPGTYSPRHSDPRLLAIPASCSRVADYNPNWDAVFGVRSASPLRLPLSAPL